MLAASVNALRPMVNQNTSYFNTQVLVLLLISSPVTCHPVNGDIELSDGFRLDTGINWSANLAPKYFLWLAIMALMALCAAIVSLQARKDPCTIYGFFAALFAMTVLSILGDQRNPVAITGPVLLLGTYFVVQYGRAQMKCLQRTVQDIYLPLLWLTGFLLTYLIARMLSLEYPVEGGFAQCCLFSFWLDISLWPFIVRLIHRMRSDSSPAPGPGRAELDGFVEAPL
jgi:hypothetical protein